MNKVNSFITNLSEINQTYWLSLREDTIGYLRDELPTIMDEQFPIGFVRLGTFVKSLRSGNYIEKDYYSDKETNYVYLSVGNFSSETPDLENKVYLDETVGMGYEATSLSPGEMVITRSGTVGGAHIFNPPDDKVYIPSHHLAILDMPDDKKQAQFLKFYVQSEFAKQFFWAYATGKSQKEITNWSIRRLPIPKTSKFSQIVRECEEIEDHIYQLMIQVKDLQDIIESIFVRYKIKPVGFHEKSETIKSSLENISNQHFLRCGAKYRTFYERHNGLLFDNLNPKYNIRKLGNLIFPSPKTVFKKGILDSEYILVELEHVEPYTGRIVLNNNIVTEVGSDKILFGDSDLLISKLRPYLGYVIINDKNKPYIGTTELLPFKVNNELATNEFLRYLLLSHGFLHVSSMLMYGKEHPRIHGYDLLNIRVPCPPLEVQESVSSEIKSMEMESFIKKQQIQDLRRKIDSVLW